ncbi:MAG: hypothetical protein WA718_10115, partial [Terriglobales bacterium]
TSTIGVTLMSELTFAPSFRFANAIEFCLLRALALALSLPVKRRASPPGLHKLQQLMCATPAPLASYDLRAYDRRMLRRFRK